MGDPRKLTAKYETPRKVWDADRIRNDSTISREYGLRKTRELWTMVEELKKVRRTARLMLSHGEEGRLEGQKILDKLSRLGIGSNDMRLEDILSLTVRDFLERRLQTRVIKKGLARTPAQARQLITHGFISVNGKKVTIPSYMVTASEEPSVSYYKAIDISVPEEPSKASGAAARKSARNMAAADAAAEAPAAGAAQAAQGAPEAS